MKEFRGQWDEEVGKLHRIEEDEEKIKGKLINIYKKNRV